MKPLARWVRASRGAAAVLTIVCALLAPRAAHAAGDSLGVAPPPKPALADTSRPAPAPAPAPAPTPAPTPTPAPAAADTSKTPTIILPAPAAASDTSKAAAPKEAPALAAPLHVRTRTPAKPKQPLERGAHWAFVRGGLAKDADKFGPNANLGFALGVRQMVFKQTSVGLVFQHDILGKFGDAEETENAVTIELLRHFHWSDNIEPYFGIGGGTFHNSIKGTGIYDGSERLSGFTLSTGVNTPITARQLLGVDLRLASIGGKIGPDNPVFGPKRIGLIHYGAKLDYIVTF